MPAECRIRILAEDVASQIAAGEVVERPASVVKELLENSIDAGATRITVEVEDGGKRLVRITDNGCGMSAQDAVLSLQRHATSKIYRAEDLAEVRTLGFRGEAMPSIASVCRLTVLTRARGELEGVRLEAEAGEIRELEVAGAAEGTTISIRDLFYNTPARLKFLRTTRSELGQICDTVTRLALSHPGISFRLLADGEEVLHAPGAADPLNTVTALYGTETARELISVRHGRPGITVEGYVSKPSFSRPTRSGQHFFVNGRWVRNRTLAHALDEAYRSLLPARRFPFAVLHLEIDPQLVDVNVHPTKAEVRFLRDWEVHRAVLEAVRAALGSPAADPGASLARRHSLGQEALRGGPWLPQDAAPVAESVAVDPFAAADPGASPTVSTPPAAPAVTQLEMAEVQVPRVPLRPVAQLWNRYILAEGPSGLAIVDQHLAHERILFDRIMRREASAGDGARSLAAPVTLHLSHAEALFVTGIRDELAQVGFQLEGFGKDAYLVRAVPEFVAPGEELAVLRGVLDEVGEARKEGLASGSSAIERAIATAACKAAVKKGQRLGMPEMQALLRDLSESTQATNCPHGCPILVELSYQELLRRFKRV